MAEGTSSTELRENLREYEEQLEQVLVFAVRAGPCTDGCSADAPAPPSHQVTQLLLDDPKNDEYKSLYDSLAEVRADQFGWAWAPVFGADVP